jgi:hypothetical protein
LEDEDSDVGRGNERKRIEISELLILREEKKKRRKEEKKKGKRNKSPMSRH